MNFEWIYKCSPCYIIAYRLAQNSLSEGAERTGSEATQVHFWSSDEQVA